MFSLTPVLYAFLAARCKKMHGLLIINTEINLFWYFVIINLVIM
jgi:hypothetical protein